VQSIIKETSTN